MKKFITFFSSLIVLIVSVIMYVGYAHRLPYGAWDKKFPLPAEVVTGVKEITESYSHSSLYEQGDFFGMSSSGLLYLLGSISLSLLVFGLLVVGLLVMCRNIVANIANKINKVRKEKKRKIDTVTENKRINLGRDDEHIDVSDLYRDSRDQEIDTSEVNEEEGDIKSIFSDLESTPSEPTTVSAKIKNKFIIPEHLLSDEMEDIYMFTNVETVVSMFQNQATERQFELIIAVLRPEFSEYVELFSEDVRNRISRQILQHHMLGLKREEAGISPGQFSAQDKRMNEAERETICRRFVPKNIKHLSERGSEIIGKVFSLTEQQKVQQFTLSQTEDWQDISLRNLVEVMQAPVVSSE